MKAIKLSDEQINNLFVFLNRVKYDGLQEVQLVQDILRAVAEGTEEEDK